MDLKVKQLWIDALRSKKYQQNFGVLKSKNGYCCLGVLCDLYNIETGQGEWEKDTPLNFIKFSTFNEGDNTKYLPEDVVQWAGLNNYNPTVILDNISKTLASLNDEGSSFEEIAKVIEEYL